MLANNTGFMLVWLMLSSDTCNTKARVWLRLIPATMAYVERQTSLVTIEVEGSTGVAPQELRKGESIVNINKRMS